MNGTFNRTAKSKKRLVKGKDSPMVQVTPVNLPACVEPTPSSPVDVPEFEEHAMVTGDNAQVMGLYDVRKTISEFVSFPLLVTLSDVQCLQVDCMGTSWECSVRGQDSSHQPVHDPMVYPRGAVSDIHQCCAR